MNDVYYLSSLDYQRYCGFYFVCNKCINHLKFILVITHQLCKYSMNLWVLDVTVYLSSTNYRFQVIASGRAFWRSAKELFRFPRM